ncbi:MAG: YeeE/YedE family protein [Gammaproteobacteria bacterium]|jgi:uncharacterized membrane protein YedE/YeeE|nr:YeeE/YedE family protein [Gammaproteobacteria bacterium]MCP4881032.1 YeeE/YedE family protein [Gammaproteobacteria bacterium]MDP6165257.1 YeeE/YedE family protein [Gammaproteobacteria bacterium]
MTSIREWLEIYSTDQISLFIGIFVGLLFGALAQQSRFCLRAATVEFWRGQAGGKLAIWLFTFASALMLTQWLIMGQVLDTEDIRQLATTGSISGAIIGGSLFGMGMILARGCASRLLVLAATGNQRALIAGLIVTLVSQASLRGGLSPARQAASSWWTISPEQRNLAQYLPEYSAMIFALLMLLVATYMVRHLKIRTWHWLGAIGVGAVISLGWGLTAWHASWSFDIVAVKSVSFTGPSADTLMGLINSPHIPITFDIGIVMGVFTGALIAALLAGEFKIQGFTEQTGLARYIIGATLMGFGGMLAGGCAVGAGITGGAVLALTAWLALLAMWLSAGITDFLIDR